MEELQMEIRRLKKAAIHHDETKERLEKSNVDNSKELDECMQQVSARCVFNFASLENSYHHGILGCRFGDQNQRLR